MENLLFSVCRFHALTGRYPERLLHWVESVPEGITVWVGHDVRSTDGRPLRRRGRAGGEVVFLDTGSGKGGHLSWVDLPV